MYIDGKYYDVIPSRNGNQALALIKENDIDIVISDIMMPEMDGLELCRTLKSDIEISHIPVILLTAKNRTEDRIECYNAGADGYITKPFELKVLEARINSFITYKKAKQQKFQSNKEINISTLDYPSLDEEFLQKAIRIIEQHLSDSEFDVAIFAEKLHLSKSSLYRKIKTMTGLSPVEFTRNIRLKHACQILQNQSLPISEVAYTVGFSDPNYFTLCFKAEFNITPTDYRKNNPA
ncbi:response regulator transcription factor [Dysgonomonas capnocytophagoides]|uniref:Response regulator transcription factor n=1 Tax=Dysgonomonas capnocytophagoides TaxID=45254 RepID=A0A4Y8LDD8_9BACT|nr:response regulator transcription factor [Dysgonomonas capnocytophagoides]